MDKEHSLTSPAAHLVTPYLNTSVTWGFPTESNVHGSAVTQSPSLKMDARSEHLINAKGTSFQDQDSPSTQSSGQSATEVANSGDDNPSKQISFSPQSDVHRELEETQQKGCANSIISGISDTQFAPSKANFSFHYGDPHFGGLMPAAYPPQATVWNPQMVGRVPLPLDFIENEPVFVNAKQFPAIMRRRKQRAKLEAQNKIIKSRKPYLHESRHVHALKRPRGSGGRFLNAKQLQELAEQEHNMSIQQQHAEGNISRSVIHQTQNSTSGSDITVASDGIDLFGHSEFQLSDCPSQTAAAMYVHGQSNDMHKGVNAHHFSVHI